MAWRGEFAREETVITVSTPQALNQPLFPISAPHSHFHSPILFVLLPFYPPRITCPTHHTFRSFFLGFFLKKVIRISSPPAHCHPKCHPKCHPNSSLFHLPPPPPSPSSSYTPPLFHVTIPPPALSSLPPHPTPFSCHHSPPLNRQDDVRPVRGGAPLRDGQLGALHVHLPRRPHLDGLRRLQRSLRPGQWHRLLQVRPVPGNDSTHLSIQFQLVRLNFVG